MTKPLPELFAEVCGKVPGFKELIRGLWYQNEHVGWRQGAEPISTALAETIIIGAAVRMLPDHLWQQTHTGDISVSDGINGYHEATTLAAAPLLAVLAQAERSGT